MRASGVLLPIFSLPGNYGIGSIGKEAYAFVDTLKAAGQKYWQILPFGPTGYGDSPYQSFSSFAGNPYFIDLDFLIERGLLTAEECREADFSCNTRYIDYGKLFHTRVPLLRRAYERSHITENEDFQWFRTREHEWLYDYAFYMALYHHFGCKSLFEWDKDIKERTPQAMEHYSVLLQDDIIFYEFIQYIFDRQWKDFKAYANSQGVQLIGDIPIYVSLDSADTWSNPELYHFDESLKPVYIAGCPPDSFSATGQLWGNPLYRWEYHEDTGYEWWCRRLRHMLSLVDIVRIDHFRGFASYYAIPYGHETAEFGHWEKGPGMRLFQTVEEKIGKSLPIIAEDLGYLTQEVYDLLDESGFPGMKVLQFAFDWSHNSTYLPHKYDSTKSVIYTGTHDNETIAGWLKNLSEADRHYALSYMNALSFSKEEQSYALIRLALSSICDTAIIPISDYIGLDNEARINFPGTMGDNWKFRLYPGEVSQDIVRRMRDLSILYGRLP